MYIIHEDTLAIVGCGKKTKVIEKNQELVFDCPWRDILNDSCLYYGSSFQGRIEGSKFWLEKGYKVPITICDGKSLLFFPLSQIQEGDCTWISFSNVLKYTGNKYQTKVFFSKENGVSFPISNYVFESQFLKAYRLERILEFCYKN